MSCRPNRSAPASRRRWSARASRGSCGSRPAHWWAARSIPGSRDGLRRSRPAIRWRPGAAAARCRHRRSRSRNSHPCGCRRWVAVELRGDAHGIAAAADDDGAAHVRPPRARAQPAAPRTPMRSVVPSSTLPVNQYAHHRREISPLSFSAAANPTASRTTPCRAVSISHSSAARPRPRQLRYSGLKRARQQHEPARRARSGPGSRAVWHRRRSAVHARRCRRPALPRHHPVAGPNHQQCAHFANRRVDGPQIARHRGEQHGPGTPLSAERSCQPRWGSRGVAIHASRKPSSAAIASVRSG